MADDGRRAISVSLYAEIRNLSEKTVYRLIKAGKIPAERYGRQYRIWVRPSGQKRTEQPTT
jgi:excisionase family DNA binding protein